MSWGAIGARSEYSISFMRTSLKRKLIRISFGFLATESQVHRELGELPPVRGQ